MTSPIRPTDNDARQLAQTLIASARCAALAYTDPDLGAPMISRILLVAGTGGEPLSLISDLSHHARALKANPACALLIGEPGPKGDPLTHPRLGLRAKARFVRHGAPEHEKLAQDILRQQPKAKVYIGFSDFSIVCFHILGAHLNGGFGKAFILTPDDLSP